MTRISSSNQKYHVPLIPNDLRQEETVHQLADVLDHLQRVADDVFKKVEKRVEENKQRLRSVNDRIETARARVEKVRGSNKATTVFSSSKYPATDISQFIPSTFTTEKSIEFLRRPNYRLNSKHDSVDERTLKEKLRFFNVDHNQERPGDKREQGEGLGRLPNEPSSVSSLLLFNTSENPYKKYVLLDPLGVVTKTRAAVQSEQFGPGDAPSTIVHGESLEQRQKETYFYVPGMGAVPEIAVPKDLPLFGVADDLSYGEDTGPSIAPSVFGKDAIPELPVLESLSGGAAAFPGPSQSGAALPPPPPPGGLPPPPPPPPPPTPADLPPPPPPPPPPAPASSASVPVPASQPISVPAPPPPDPAGAQASPAAKPDQGLPDRSSLLNDIRNAGIGKLKSVKEKKVQKKKEKEVKKVESSGGDLMSDLAAKLQLRRKGISGGGGGGASGGKSAGNAADDGPPRPQESDAKPVSALDRMSSLIAYTPATNSKDADDWSD